jgi:hypothetical protein
MDTPNLISHSTTHQHLTNKDAIHKKNKDGSSFFHFRLYRIFTACQLAILSSYHVMLRCYGALGSVLFYILLFRQHCADFNSKFCFISKFLPHSLLCLCVNSDPSTVTLPPTIGVGPEEMQLAATLIEAINIYPNASSVLRASQNLGVWAKKNCSNSPPKRPRNLVGSQIFASSPQVKGPLKLGRGEHSAGGEFRGRK